MNRDAVERAVAEARESHPLPRIVDGLDAGTRLRLERAAAQVGMSPQATLDEIHRRIEAQATARESASTAAAIAKAVR